MSSRATRCRRCQILAARTRYERGEKRKAAQLRYWGTDKGRAVKARHNARRIFIGKSYRGTAQTIEQATVIQRHIQERLREFISRRTDGFDVAPMGSPSGNSAACNGR